MNMNKDIFWADIIVFMIILLILAGVFYFTLNIMLPIKFIICALASIVFISWVDATA